MKRTITIMLMAMLCMQGIQAQTKKEAFGFFDHLGLGVSVGTDGIGFDLATPVSDYAALRAGLSFWPKVKYSTNIDINDNNATLEPNVDIEGKLNIFDFKVLADFYPFKKSSFHLTTGVFFGKEELVTATNTSMFIKDPSKYGNLGLMLGKYRISTDRNGYIKADGKVNGVKPYVGLGFGRAVPKKHRLSVSCDLGVQFWGTPQLGAMTKDDWGNEYYHKFKSSDLDEYDDEDLKDALDKAEKFTVFPVLNIRISGRIF